MRYVVRLVDFDTANHLINSYNFRAVQMLPRMNMLVFEYDSKIDSFVIPNLRKESNVQYVQPDYVVTLDMCAEEVEVLDYPPTTATQSTLIGTFSDGQEFYGHLELLNSLDYQQNTDDHTYETTRSGEGVDIYVVDTGVNFNHPYLTGRVFRTELDLNLEAMEDDDNNGHGTTSALFAAGSLCGPAPDARIYSLKALKGSKSGSSIDIILSIDEVIRHHNEKNGSRPSILNLSLGMFPKSWNPYVWGDYTGDDHYLNDGAKEAAAAGVHVTIAAGNGFYGKDSQDNEYVMGPMLSTLAPGNLHLSSEETGNDDPGQGDVIVVGAVETKPGGLDPWTVSGKMASFSNYGKGNTINAPGANILIPQYDWGHPDNPNNNYKWGNGTSYACPMVAGLLALHLQGNPTQSPAETKDWLISNGNRGSITNLMEPLEVPYSNIPSELTKALGWEEIQIGGELIMTVIFELTGSNRPNFEEHFNEGDLIQFEFDDSEGEFINPSLGNDAYEWWKNNIAEFNDGWWEVVITQTYEEPAGTIIALKPRLGLPTEQPLSGGLPIELIGDEFGFVFPGALKIAKVSGTHTETDGVKAWQLEDENNRLTGSSAERIMETEYTDNLVIFNPYQSYSADWGALEEVSELRFPSAFDNSPLTEVKLKTIRGEVPSETSFAIESGSLLADIELSASGEFFETTGTSAEASSANRSPMSTVTISATNGYQTFIKTLDVFDDDAPPNLLSNIKNMIWHGFCSTTGQDLFDLETSSFIESVSQIDNSSTASLIWKHDVPSFVPQPFSKLEPGHAYCVVLKSSDGINPDSSITIPNAVVSGEDSLGLNIRRC